MIIQKFYRLTAVVLCALMAGCSTLPKPSPAEHAPAATPAATPAKEKGEEASHRRRLAEEIATENESASISTTLLPNTPPLSVEAPPAIDIWDRIRSGFGLKIEKNPRVTRQLRWLKRHKEYLNRALKAGRPYLHFILEETEKRGIPTEFALLPIIESGFKPFAYSPSRAAGIWQFVSSTARQHGVAQNWWYEGRRDIVASTWAALDHLELLADKYNGDWELALAAYNSGVGTVYKALRHNRRRGRPTDYWSLTLPRETQNYVPRLLAIAQIMKDPAKYGFRLPSIPNRPYFRIVDIGGQLDISLAAKLAGVTLGELQHLNPGWRRWATGPSGPHRLLIPVEKADHFLQQLAALSPNERLRWTRYRVRSGDSLSVIAQRYGTTITALKQSNNLRGSRIRTGQRLLIPLSQQALVGKGVPPLSRPPSRRIRRTHTVRRGESLWDISRRYGVGYLQLAKWNNLSTKRYLKPGQKLTVWLNSDADSPVQGPLIAALDSTTSPQAYRVKKGDSLSHIAQRFKVSVKDIRRWNTLTGKYIRPGQTLTLFPR